MAQDRFVLPFTAAAHRYRESIHTPAAITPATATNDMSPPGGAIKSSGYLRALHVLVTSSGGSGGNIAADGPWNIINQCSVTQPNGEELYGGPTWNGYYAYQAAKHSGWKLANDPATFPSYSATAASPRFVTTIPFEINAQLGLGSLPNQDFSAPFKLQLVANTSANIWQTAPTTTPALTFEVFMDCWTVPSRQNPLNPSVEQEVAPPLLGTLNKWTVQQYAVSSSTATNILLSRKGNAIRNLVFVALNSSSARVGTPPLYAAGFGDPISVRWDGTVIRSNDMPLMIADDEYRTRGGQAAATPTTADTGVIALQMADITGVDTQGTARDFGMGAFWGTVQSSVIEVDGTTGSSIATFVTLTNDVQFVNLAGNPYAFAYAGYLQAPAQASART